MDDRSKKFLNGIYCWSKYELRAYRESIEDSNGREEVDNGAWERSIGVESKSESEHKTQGTAKILQNWLQLPTTSSPTFHALPDAVLDVQHDLDDDGAADRATYSPSFVYS